VFYPDLLGAWPGTLLEVGIALLGALFFSDRVLAYVAHTQRALAQQNEALRALQHQVQTIAIVEERDRLAREMPDSVAQVLGYVNVKAQAATQLLARGDAARAAGQIEQLGDAARAAYG